ncbi:hypothetical protein ACQPYK_49525 (plasmid) [Streptosporangium sp. CA-135522]|uniref:hypothetical protein n=1 Tax=Streptosporangium sp. CA-135522 TaxID=3240072 RepID=UPI003D8CC460
MSTFPTAQRRRTALASPTDPHLDQARQELTARLNHIIGVLTGRTDVLLDTVWDQPEDVPAALFDITRAEIVINGDLALPPGTDPADVDPTTTHGRLAHPVLIGLCCHEAGHARAHGWNTSEPAERSRTAPRAGELAGWLEELWIEAGQLRHRPTDRRWLRAAARHLIKPPDLPDEPTEQQLRLAAGFSAILILGRVDAGVLDAADVDAIDQQVRDVLGDQVLAELTDRWCQALALNEGDVDGLFTLAEEIRDLLGLDDDFPDALPFPPGMGCALGAPAAGGSASDSDGASASGASASSAHPLADAVADLAGEVSEASITQAAADLADLEAAHAPDADAMAGRAHEATERAAAAAQAASTFTPGGGHGTTPDGPVTGQRSPATVERVAANTLAIQLRRVRYRGRATTVTSSALPPGRLSGRTAVLAAAQHAMGLPVTAQPFRQLRRRHVDQPPLTVGIAVDVSGSMEDTARAMASLSWVMAHAVAQVQGRSATLAWGSALTPLTWPGQVPGQVPILNTNEGTSVLPEAIRALDGALGLATGRGARLLVIASDGELDGTVQMRTTQALIERLTRYGCGVLQLCLDGTAHVLPGAVPVSATRPQEAARAIGQTAIDALRRANA